MSDDLAISVALVKYFTFTRFKSRRVRRLWFMYTREEKRNLPVQLYGSRPRRYVLVMRGWWLRLTSARVRRRERVAVGPMGVTVGVGVRVRRMGVRVWMMMVMQISPHWTHRAHRTPHPQSTHYLNLLAHCLHHP